MKFGGTSVEDAAAFERVKGIVCAHEHERPVVVVSAMSLVTDPLVGSVQVAASGDVSAALRGLEDHFARHERVAHELLSDERRLLMEAAIEEARADIAGLLHSVAAHEMPRAGLQDEIVSYGERLSARLLAFVLGESGLKSRYVDARRLIITNDEHGSAAPLLEETERHTRAALIPLIENGEVIVLGGFIGSTQRGRTTTLGRGGSDYTAAIIGANLDAREIQIWTDVNGVLTADPRLDRDAGHGMSVTVGRIARDTVLDYRFVTLSHNTIRGAAGAAILNAELLIAKRLLV